MKDWKRVRTERQDIGNRVFPELRKQQVQPKLCIHVVQNRVILKYIYHSGESNTHSSEGMDRKARIE